MKKPVQSEVLRKIHKKRKRRRIIAAITAVLLIAVTAAVYYIVTEYSMENIQVKGNYTYTTGEVVDAVEKEDFVPNTLVMTAQSRIFKRTYLPFIARMKMNCRDHHVLRIEVEEKMRAGVFKYMKRYIYFNDNGYAMESRKTLFEHVPVVTGVKFQEVTLSEKIKVKGDYFDTIVSLAKLILSYNLDISEIHFEGEDDITLVSGSYRIHLGSTKNLKNKIENISPVLESVSEKSDKGTIDMSLYTDEKKTITFHK